MLEVYGKSASSRASRSYVTRAKFGVSILTLSAPHLKSFLKRIFSAWIAPAAHAIILGPNHQQEGTFQQSDNLANGSAPGFAAHGSRLFRYRQTTQPHHATARAGRNSLSVRRRRAVHADARRDQGSDDARAP